MIYKHPVPQLLNLIYRRFSYLYLNDTSPVVASIKITQRCNLRCRHCTWVNKVTEDLSLERWREIIDRIYDRGCFVVFIEGGEPTLRKDLSDIIRYIKSKGMVCVMFSNGTGMLPKADLDAVWISIDGTERSHDALRGSGTYKKVMRTLEESAGRNIYSLTTLSKANSDEVENICAELSETNLKGMIFNFMYPYKDISSEVLSKEERVKCAELLMELKAKYPKIISSDSYFKAVGSAGKSCYPWLLLLVTADGKITQGCTVEPAEERDCDICDMMCGLEATLGFELHRDSMKFWNHFNILADIDVDKCPEWALRMARLNRKSN